MSGNPYFPIVAQQQSTFTSGTFTPSVSNIAGPTPQLVAATSLHCYWINANNIITMTGQLQLQGNNTTAFTLDLTLPVQPTNNFSDNLQMNGVVSGTIYPVSPTYGFIGFVRSVAAAKRARLDCLLVNNQSFAGINYITYTLTYNANN